MANEITKVTDQNGDDHPFKDAVAQNGVIANTKLIKDTVGWSGKNIFDFEGWLKANNNSFTKNADGSYQFWTNNSIFEHRYVFSDTDVDIILSSEISYPSSSPAVGAGFDLLNSNNEVVATLSANATARACKIRFNRQTAGNVIVKNPMIRLATYLDPTYEPYFGSTAFPRSEQAVLGAKNLIVQPYANQPSLKNTGDTVVSEGLTWRLNADKSVTAVSGTGTNVGQIILTGRADDSNTLKLKKGKYILNGSPITNNNTVNIHLATTVNGTYTEIPNAQSKNNSDAIFEIIDDYLQPDKDYATIAIYCACGSGALGSPLTFNPMIRLATDPDPTYAPYAMTNKELTEKVQGIIDAATNAADFAAFKTAIGNL